MTLDEEAAAIAEAIVTDELFGYAVAAIQRGDTATTKMLARQLAIELLREGRTTLPHDRLSDVVLSTIQGYAFGPDWFRYLGRERG